MTIGSTGLGGRRPERVGAGLVLLLAWAAVPALAAATGPEPSPPATSGGRSAVVVHVVRQGETLWAIARQHQVPLQQLTAANRLADPDRLQIGDRVLVPGPGLPAAAAERRPPRPSMDWPSRGIVTSRFGFRGKRHHHGIDIAAPIGAPIAATQNGLVQFAGWQAGYGRLVILNHGDGLTTWYGHASKILVKVGQRVARGEVIAQVGISGEVTGPNVHFEVRRNNRPLDPTPFLTARRP